MSAPTPLAGIKVVEFTHMVMGPTVGHILAGLGAEVVREYGGEVRVLCLVENVSTTAIVKQILEDGGQP